MTKKYQTTEIDTSALAVPEQVNLAMEEGAADMREGLLALAVGAGLQVMQSLMEADVAAVCGPRGKHDPDRTATRHGTERGSVSLGGRRPPAAGDQAAGARHRRRRRAAGAGVRGVHGTELLGRMAMERMQAGV